MAFSIQVLGLFLHDIVLLIHGNAVAFMFGGEVPTEAHLTHSTRLCGLVSARLLVMGWCPTFVKMLQHYASSVLLYFVATGEPPSDGLCHASCSRTIYLSGTVYNETYEKVHICGDLLECSIIEVPGTDSRSTS